MSRKSIDSDKSSVYKSSILESPSPDSKDSSSIHSIPEVSGGNLLHMINPNNIEGYNHTQVDDSDLINDLVLGREYFDMDSRYDADYDRIIFDSFEHESRTQDKEGQCLICYQNKMLKCFGYCFHFFCEDCLRNFFTTELSQFSSASMKCPSCQGHCLSQLPSELLSEEQMKKYDKLLKIMTLKENEQLFQWCPTRKCEGYAIATRDNFNISCNTCGLKFCYNCLKPWHNKKCGKKRGLSYAIWVFANNVKKCPKCFSHIQKNGGCPHMTCKMCNYEWCWTCGTVYSSTHRRYWCYLGKSVFELNWWFIFFLILFPVCFPFLLLFLYDMILQTEGMIQNDHDKKCLKILNNRIIMSVLLFILGPPILALLLALIYILGPILFALKQRSYGYINLFFLLIVFHLFMNISFVFLVFLMILVPVLGIFSIFLKILSKLKKQKIHSNNQPLIDDNFF